MVAEGNNFEDVDASSGNTFEPPAWISARHYAACDVGYGPCLVRPKGLKSLGGLATELGRDRRTIAGWARARRIPFYETEFFGGMVTIWFDLAEVRSALKGPLQIHLERNWEALQFRSNLRRAFPGYAHMPREMIAKIASRQLGKTYSPEQIYRALKKAGLSYKREERLGRFRICETVSPPLMSNRAWRDKYFAPAPRLKMTAEKRKMVIRLQSKYRRDSQVWKRCEIILRAANGIPNMTIANQLELSRPTILTWRQRYKDAGLKRFTEFPSGRGHPTRHKMGEPPV